MIDNEAGISTLKNRRYPSFVDANAEREITPVSQVVRQKAHTFHIWGSIPQLATSLV